MADDEATSLPGLDLDAVLAWLDGHAPGLFRARPGATMVAGGRSNLTYVLDDGSRKVVLRRPPLGHVLATAHDMSREHRMIGALAGTSVPVPQPIALCEDPSVNGAPFYLMSHVDGMVFRRSADLDDHGVDTDGRERLARVMMEVLADLHGVDPAEVGLAGYGKPEGFMARQVRRWGLQLEASHNRELPGVDKLRDDLAASVPDPVVPSGIVHGDYRLDNLIVGGPGEPDEFEVRAVLDWEMATLGDPLADVGLLVAYWDGVSALDSPIAGRLGPSSGFPDGQALAQWYGERRGVSLDTLPWYVAFGLFKIAGILEGIHYRYVHGQTVGPGFDKIGLIVPGLVDRGLETLETYQKA